MFALRRRSSVQRLFHALNFHHSKTIIPQRARKCKAYFLNARFPKTGIWTCRRRIEYFRKLRRTAAGKERCTYVFRSSLAGLQQYALLTAAVWLGRLVPEAAHRRRVAALSRTRRAGRSRRAKRAHRAQPPPRGTHHEQGLKQSDVFRCEKMTRCGSPNFRKISSSTRSRVLPFLTTM